MPYVPSGLHDRIRVLLAADPGLERPLRRMGVVVYPVASEQEAVEEASQRRFGAYLVKETSTARALRQARFGPDTPILFMGAAPDLPKRVEDEHLAGPVDYCFEPLDAAVFEQKIEELRRRYQTARRHRALQRGIVSAPELDDPPAPARP